MEGTKPLIARVLLESPLPQLDHLFDYEVPEQLKSAIKIGQKVKVPFRSRQRGITGYVVELVNESEFPGKLAQVAEIVSPIPLLKQEIWELARSLADRAGGNAGDILRLAIPSRQVRVEKKYLADVQKKFISNPVPESELLIESSKPDEITQKLLESKRLHFDISGPPVRLDTGEWVLKWVKILSQTALNLLAEGKSAIIVVPDFRDIEQLNDTLSAAGVEKVLRFDTRISNATRYKNFLISLEDEPQIVIGNRSAVYAPVYNLGAILVWDEADESLIEPLSPYVHARDAALMRAAMAKSGLVFASYTRTTQMQRLIEMKYLEPLKLQTKSPSIIHTASLLNEEEQFGRIPPFVYKTIREGIKRGPVLVQVSSPGFSPAMICSSCKQKARCNKCTGPFHSAINSGVICRLCLQTATAWKCHNCDNNKMVALGAGTERTAQQLASAFPEAKIIVSDGNHKRMRVDSRPSLVIATRGAEPLAAGGYVAVVILDVEKTLSSWHLHAGEDALRWWRGAIANAAEKAVCVLAGGGGAVVDAFTKNMDEEWALVELEDRALLRFPPAVRIVTLTGNRQAINSALNTVKDIPGTDVLGPTNIGNGDYRAIVRFEYAKGLKVAKVLRAELLRGIAERSAQRYVQSKSRPGYMKNKVLLRLKFDDETVFDERGQNSEDGI